MLQSSMLSNFLQPWESDYREKLSSLPMFAENGKYWIQTQQKFFAKSFYHVRGHFGDFLWTMLAHSTSLQTRDIIMHNINGEMAIGDAEARPHEQLYFDFAEAVGVSRTELKEEIKSQQTYLDFLKRFKKGHLDFLLDHDEETQFSAFSAYEKLDNADYESLSNLAKSFGVPDKALIFFKVHENAEHYDDTENRLQDIWAHNPGSVRTGFSFIATHQLEMGNALSKTIENMHSHSY